MKVTLLTMFALLWTLPVAALVIDTDTLWTGERSFAEDVRVMPGATLTVAPGARIHFAGGRLEIAGRLLAEQAEFSGEDWGGLVLKGLDEKSLLADCVIRGAATGVFVQGGRPRLHRLTLIANKVGIELRGKASGSIANCRFVDNLKVGLFLKDDSTAAVVDCVFEGNAQYGAYLYHAMPQRFTGNRFTGNTIALMIAYHGSDPQISGNRFEGNQVAVQVDRAARPVLSGNLLRDNRTAIHVYRRSDPLVTGNRIEANDIGLLVAYSSYPHIEGNDFVANRMALRLEFQSSAWEAQRGAAARAGETTARSAFAGQGMRSVSEEDRRASSLDGVVVAQGNWWGDAGTVELARIGVQGNPSFIHDRLDQATFIDAGEEYPLDRVAHAPWSARPLTEIEP